jgi:hypothetical protein
MASIPPPLLEEVLCHRDLRLESENALLDFLCDLKPDAHWLLRYVRCEWLSADSLERYIDAVYPDNLDLRTWYSVCSRLQQTAVCAPEPDRFKIWTFDRSQSESGMLAHIAAKRRNFSASISGGGGVKHCITFDFKGPRVSVSEYWLDSWLFRTSPVAWDLEASNDEISWTVIDSQKWDIHSGGQSRESWAEREPDYVRKCFECAAPSAELYRYVRLTQTGGKPGHLGFGEGALSSLDFARYRRNPALIEFFGQLMSLPSDFTKSH